MNNQIMVVHDIGKDGRVWGTCRYLKAITMLDTLPCVALILLAICPLWLRKPSQDGCFVNNPLCSFGDLAVFRKTNTISMGNWNEGAINLYIWILELITKRFFLHVQLS